MKKYSLLILISSLFIINSQAQDTDSFTKTRFIYPGTELDSFLIDNTVRPYLLKSSGAGANVDVSFIVDRLGIVVNPQITKVDYSLHTSKNNLIANVLFTVHDKDNLDSTQTIEQMIKNEAIRVGKYSSGLWVPASQNYKKI
ncbi:MAG: hypothetical protein B6I19_08090 [Bacteroidetes bacterium 4572_114]|nr:MAG: hypothetical protein B6I19_08090 [Bacteroidetes bacterium 4572_114]